MSEVSISSPPGQVRSLIACSHPKQALFLAVTLAGFVLGAGRPGREVLVTFGAVLLVQLILGIHNDVADREDDVRSGADGKPIAAEWLPVGNATFAIAALTLLAIPLSLQNGFAAGATLLGTLVIGFVHNRFLHRGRLSWVGWTATFGLLPAFLTYGGWGKNAEGDPPTIAVTLAVAAFGFCLHFVTSLPDLVIDNKAGLKHLPLRIALKIGAPKLMIITGVATVLAAAAILISALSAGISQ